MKCGKPGTDQEAEFCILVNDAKAPEFVLPSSDPTDPDVLECFIAVEDGDELAIRGNFSGSVVHADFDFCADGAFVTQHQIVGKDGILKLWKGKRYLCDSFFDNPKPKGWPSAQEPPNIVECSLQVRALSADDKATCTQHEIPKFADTRVGLGMLAVVVSLSQGTTDSYQHDYFNKRLGSWRERTNEAVRDSGIQPQYELRAKVIDSNVRGKRSTAHRHRFDQERVGNSPWARFIFYYRSRTAILDAGCIPRVDEAQMLEAAVPGSFTASKRIAGAGVLKGKRKNVDDDEAAQKSGNSGLVSPESKNTDSSQDTPSKRGRLGGTLVLRKESVDSRAIEASANEKTIRLGGLISAMREYQNRGKEQEPSKTAVEPTEANGDSSTKRFHSNEGQESSSSSMLEAPMGQLPAPVTKDQDSVAMQQEMLGTKLGNPNSSPLPGSLSVSASGQAFLAPDPSSETHKPSSASRPESATKRARRERGELMAMLLRQNEEKKATRQALEERKRLKEEKIKSKLEQKKMRNERNDAEIARLKRENAEQDAKMAEVAKEIEGMHEPSSGTDESDSEAEDALGKE